MGTLDSLVGEVRRATLNGEAVETALANVVRNANERNLGEPLARELDETELRSLVIGFGRIQALLDDANIEEIWINGPNEVFIARGGIHESLPIALSDDEVRTLVERMLLNSGRRIDLSQPFVDSSLPDGSRLHVVIPPITREFWSVNIRKFPKTVRTIDELAENGSIEPAVESRLREAINAGQTVLVSGATQAGKTTLLCALLDAMPERERIVTIEETFEIASRPRDLVGMQCRGASLEGTGTVTLRHLVREALRMRPTRIVVGEVRGDEALDLLVALNSGIPGLCTIHANSAGDAIRKLVTLCQLSGTVAEEFVSRTLLSTVDLVVHCRMSQNGSRKVVQLARPVGVSADGVIEMETIWSS